MGTNKTKTKTKTTNKGVNQSQQGAAKIKKSIKKKGK